MLWHAWCVQEVAPDEHSKPPPEQVEATVPEQAEEPPDEDQADEQGVATYGHEGASGAGDDEPGVVVCGHQQGEGAAGGVDQAAGPAAHRHGEVSGGEGPAGSVQGHELQRLKRLKDFIESPAGG